MLKLNELKAVYKKYGFSEQRGCNENVAVFSIKTGHYHNADIVPLTDSADINTTFEQYKQLGYACQTKSYKTAEEANKALFHGFFSIDSTKDRLRKEYKNFTDSIVKIHSDDAKYSFIHSKYYINGKLGEKGLIDEITDRLVDSKPILFLIEAAAGFGKTCSAYELLYNIINTQVDCVPLFTELSRNRQAKIFRYVLLDEIDRSFPLLSSSLVRNEIRNGNVPVILDGFDELLHESVTDSDRNYENTEPMLETISELLTDKAKIVLTTRRTAIFDGDDFHQWMSSHEEDFEIIRIRIQEPKVEDWLCADRLQSIIDSGFPINNISNPVLLSFLRCISDVQFETVKSEPRKLVDKYFESMLERERKRQDLLMSPKDQYDVLKKIADDMIDLNYTSESRDYICSLILEGNLEKLEHVRKLYTIDVRPTTDELVNKLASHALLDRAGGDSQGIGFVNEFVFGSFCADSIISDSSGEWAGDKRFIEPAVQSYLPRTEDEKNLLWHSLEFVLEFMSGADKIRYNHALTRCMKMPMENDSVEMLVISNIELGSQAILKDTIFVDCKFINSIFNFNGMGNVTFVNTVFFDCRVTNGEDKDDIYFLGCEANNDFLNYLDEDEDEYVDSDSEFYTSCDIYILEKFCPKGSSSFHKHRPIKGLCTKNNQFEHYEILKSISKLKKENILLLPDKRSFLELNLERMAEVKSVLGKQ